MSHVARRSGVHYSKKDTYYYRNNIDDHGPSRSRDQRIRRRNGYSLYLGAIETDDGRGVKRDWELGELSSRGRSNDAFISGSNETSKFEGGVSMPSEKKRKLSPVVWDRDEKEVRISSKNRPFQKSVPLCSPPYLPESFGESTNVASDGDITMYCVLGMQISPVKSHAAAWSVGNCESEVQPNSPDLMSPEQCKRNNQELGLLEDEYVEYRHVSTSRWAYEEYSPRKLCSDNGDIYSSSRVENHANLLNTSETGEFCLEGSEGSGGNSSASDGRHSLREPASWVSHPENDMDSDDFVEIDEKHDEVSHVDWDVEDEEDSYRFHGPASPESRSTNLLQGCRSMSKYEGNKHPFVFRHPLVMVVKEVVVDKDDDLVDKEDDVFMVMEYMERDLKGLTEVMKYPFSEKEVKCLMRQLLEGVKYLHDNWILHRDLKTSNLLLNNRGGLKICDLGMSHQYGSPLKPYTPLVVTLWYSDPKKSIQVVPRSRGDSVPRSGSAYRIDPRSRAPEILLGMEQYSTAIDMWSVGCIMAELLTKQPLFNGKTEVEQLDKIFRILGTPNETIWPGFFNLPGAKVKYVKHW
ncbi:Cyclin-dependent kinase [Actinidia chinensis var. chinensis]|uniref:Cyclin-dependent kinase n=1 Tax=Actinidia chinensis var. chinensis TaxID=1590841 RepID=A0A2R6QGE2_ACTCC|nr:Cyclin-dependent kinase [Actinidia chinensis var. chinensis]